VFVTSKVKLSNNKIWIKIYILPISQEKFYVSLLLPADFTLAVGVEHHSHYNNIYFWMVCEEGDNISSHTLSL
jgi:hypothetical protein